MFQVRRNVLANAAGQAIPAALAVVLIPFYLRFLGPEGYGIVAFTASLQAILSTLDLGLGTTANREVARLRPSEGHRISALIRTLEIVYVFVGFVLASGVVLSAGFVAAHLVNATETPPATVELAIQIAGVTLGLRWPLALYAGVLRGIERQVVLNSVMAGASVARGLGAILVLALVSPTVTAFLWWTLAVGVAETVVLGLSAWRLVPESSVARRFDPAVLRGIWRFSLQISAISIFAAILKQMDKVLVAALLPLEQLGYYSVAWSVAQALLFPAVAISTAIFPRLTVLLSAGKVEEAAGLFHSASRSVSFIVAPAAALLIFFSRDLLLLWTRSPDVAASAHLTLTVLASALLLNAMMQVPNALQLAAGLTWLPLTHNGISVLVLTPITYVLVSRFGILGAGFSWAIFNGSYYFVIPHIIHRHVMRGHLARWIGRDTMLYALGGIAAVGTTALLTQGVAGSPWRLIAPVFAVAAYAAVLWPGRSTFLQGPRGPVEGPSATEGVPS